MRADDWIVDYLIQQGVTDVFGIPGVVVMDFLYAVDRRKPEITPHLTYHEQGGAFAACGYAQATGKLGVAYSTRGPGFTNMLTAMADAYYDSVPVLFVTAHSTLDLNRDMRVFNNQEIDTVELAKSVTKKAVRIDDVDSLQTEMVDLCRTATTGRKGPVFVDIYSGLFSKTVEGFEQEVYERTGSEKGDDVFPKTVYESIKKSKRPIFLIGNGIRNNINAENLSKLSKRYSIPVLSSRGAQDVLPGNRYYYGFVGSRGIRYSNFVLSKADLIISIGNRMAFPIHSKSFLPVVEKAKTIRVDVDESEFERIIPNSQTFKLDAETAISELLEVDLSYQGAGDWIKVCDELRERLDNWDENWVIEKIERIIGDSEICSPITCDVGNHSFWVTTAYTYQKAKNRIMYSGSFGTLGSALPKAIGAYYSTQKNTMCFTGDQGVQFNIQELQYIGFNQIPITVVVLNNRSSGMIMEREMAKYGDHLVHTTMESGYSYPDFKSIANCYGLDYYCVKEDKGENPIKIDYSKPSIVEIIINKDMTLDPSLPVGNPCQNLFPELPRDVYEELNSL